MARLRRSTLLGYDVSVREAGSGDEGVVLVHGIGVSSRYFAPLVELLAASGRVLAPDLPGFGASSRTEHDLTIEEHAAVVAALIEESGLQRPVVLGHSMGAQVAAELAVQRPDLVGRLVLVGPVVQAGTRSVARQAWRLVRDYRYETRAVNAITLTDWFRCGLRRYVRTLGPMMGYPLEQRLAEVSVPVVMVRGERDLVAPLEYLELLAARCRSGAVVEVPGEGHVAMWRRPDAVAEICRGVLR
ncbi:MAG: putative hydrolase or acyltransferase of alpha/beta superfamily [Actinotalea sp.]|nr:putative hydrolase or acyltransferase of alpha/beta superfamily [Actinotalea sp.]